MQDKVVVIVGATGGSGSALTHRLAPTGTGLVPYFSSVVGLQLMSDLQIQPRRVTTTVDKSGQPLTTQICFDSRPARQEGCPLLSKVSFGAEFIDRQAVVLDCQRL